MMDENIGNHSKENNSDQSEWSAKYKFSYFYTLNHCIRNAVGFISKKNLSEKDLINLPQGGLIKGPFEIVPSSFNKKNHTIHYFVIRNEWINNRIEAHNHLCGETAMQCKEEDLLGDWDFDRQEDLVGYLIGKESSNKENDIKEIKDIISVASVNDNEASVDNDEAKVDLRKLIRALIVHLDKKLKKSAGNPFLSMDWMGKDGLREKFALEDNFTEKWRPDRMEVEDWFKFYYNLFSPCSWMEEGIVYNKLKDMTKDMTKDNRQLPVFFDMKAGKKKANIEFNGKKIKNYLRKVSCWGSGQKEEIEIGEGYEKNEIGKFTDIAMKLKDISSLLLRNFSNADMGLTGYSSSPCLIFPIYAVYIDNQGYGGIWGFYYLRYTEDEQLDDTVTTVVSRVSRLILDGLTSLITNVGRIMVTLTTTVSNGTENTDEKNVVELITPALVEASYKLFESALWRIESDLDEWLAEFGNYTRVDKLFLQSIINIQDWKNIWITKKPYSENITEEDIISHWGREKDKDEFLGKGWEELTSKKGGSELKELKADQFFQWKLKDIDMFLTTPSEKEEFSDLLDWHIICQYPEVVSLPKFGSEPKFWF